MSDDAEVDFFGAHIKVKSARLAALLNSAVTDDVVVVGKRARELVSPDEREDEVNRALDGVEVRGEVRISPPDDGGDGDDGDDEGDEGDDASGTPAAGPTIQAP
jgi:hypothetical protein